MTASTLLDPEQLNSIRLFQSLNRNEIERICRAARRRTIEADVYLYFQGDPAKIIYVLAEGRIKLTQVTPEGQQIILHYAGPGDAFGVIAVLSESFYPVTAQAVDHSLVWYWDEESMHGLMQEQPVIAFNALGILAGRVREFQDRVRELSTERVERRIAHALLRLARQTGHKIKEGVLINMPLSRQDLAEMTGTTLYTVSRTLSRWEAQGLILSGRERVIIRFPHGLVSIAEDLPARDTPSPFLNED